MEVLLACGYVALMEAGKGSHPEGLYLDLALILAPYI